MCLDNRHQKGFDYVTLHFFHSSLKQNAPLSLFLSLMVLFQTFKHIIILFYNHLFRYWPLSLSPWTYWGKNSWFTQLFDLRPSPNTGKNEQINVCLYSTSFNVICKLPRPFIKWSSMNPQIIVNDTRNSTEIPWIVLSCYLLYWIKLSWKLLTVPVLKISLIPIYIF